MGGIIKSHPFVCHGFQWNSYALPIFMPLRSITIHQIILIWSFIIPIWLQITLRSTAFPWFLLKGYFVGHAIVGRGGRVKGDSKNLSGWKSGQLEGIFHVWCSLFNTHENHMGILWKYPFWFMKSRVEATICIFIKLPGDVQASGPWTSLWVARS